MHVLWFQDTKAAAKEEEAFATDELEYTEHGAVSAGALARCLFGTSQRLQQRAGESLFCCVAGEPRRFEVRALVQRQRDQRKQRSGAPAWRRTRWPAASSPRDRLSQDTRT